MDAPHDASDPAAVQRMFARIAPRYDRANDVLSLGLHRAWKRRAVRLAHARRGDRALDLATGTGDLVGPLARAVGEKGRVVAVDLTIAMLRVARGRLKGPAWTAADALHLPLRDGSVDAVTMAFGIRNVPDPVACLREIRRVLRVGQRAVVLEFGQPRGPLGAPFGWYSRAVIPRVGGWLTGDRSAYEYLPRTAAAFPSGKAFEALVREAGLAPVLTESLLGGVAWLYVAER
ncbi:MAG TPA: bifunctional demethylmenaquinone methyltransferase/2-methoxy-6-polyprenyl-1,4-benzoquinol methylase UbiE [Candidatus Thermoplasmatota archaeon]|nr:bifunctional demethylmenaquinone methyltransferase/2-methoxy-6-polyprenyl-1,4-benzoquinol methylase UbiE [Candidatus Thermoplasmatota archaeon]